MLPLDEEPFDIDVNKRLITVPSHFKTHGVGVIGDEIAETVFFKVARFFDAMDLNTCDIYVQWSNKDGQEYATPITLRDIDSEPGYIVFAWPISSTITQQAGTIKFSVRFLKDDAISGHIVYSLNTLTAEVKINNGLNFDVGNTTADDVSQLFAAAIENSQSATGIPAAIPVFHINLQDSDNNVLTPEYMYLVPQSDGTRKLTLTVYADTPDTGTISYEWYKRVGPTIGSRLQDPDVEIILVETQDLAPQSNKTYYTAENNLYDVTSGFDPDVQAYERHCQLTLSGSEIVDENSADSLIGEYYVKAVNRFGNREAEITSNVITLPAPADITITQELITGTIENEAGYTLIVSCDADEHGTTSYSWSRIAPNTENAELIPDADTNTYAATEPGYYQVKVTSEVNLVAKEATSNTVRVTNMPTAVEFNGRYAKEQEAIELNINTIDEDTIDLSNFITAPEVDEKFSSDGIEYRWYIDKDGLGVLDGNELGDEEFVEITNNVDVPIIEGLMALGADTKIRCVATNTLNGHIVRSESVRFDIIAKVAE